MLQFEGIGEAAQAANEFYFTNKSLLPAHIAEPLSRAIGMTRSPVDAVITVAEVAYAYHNEEELPEGFKELGAACASFAASHGFHGFDIGSRGDNISLLLRGRKLISGVEAPEVKPEYISISVAAEVPILAAPVE
jgi:hypothetical protein